MRIYTCLFVLCSLVCSGTALFADDDVDGSKKTIVFRFADRAAVPDKAEDAKKPKVQTESFEFLSIILPSNLKREIGESGQFVVEMSDEIPAFSFGKDEAAVIEGMKLAAERFGAQFVVAGSYEVVKKSLSIDCYIYAYKANKLIPVSLQSEKLGAMIDKTISDLSGKIASEMDRYIVKRAGTPVISPDENRFDRYFYFSIAPASEGDELWYTTNGDEPVRGKSSRFTEPFRVRSSSRIKAIGYREGMYVSKSAMKDVTIDRPLARLTVGQSFGTMFFVGAWRNKMTNNDGRMNTFYSIFELANFESLKEKPFVKDLGISAEYFSGNVEADEGNGKKSKGYLMSGLGGLVYTYRYIDFASLELGAHCGVVHTVVNNGDDDKGNGWKDLFGIPARKEQTMNKFAFGARGRVNFIFSRFVVHGDVGILRVQYSDDPMTAVTLGMGLGVRF